jgi:hypothetical protein
LACSVLLLALPAARAEFALSGFVQQDSSVATDAANPDGRHDKWLEERAQLKVEAGDDPWRVLAKGDLAYDHLDEAADSELREAHVSYTASAWDVRIGRQIMTWGLGDLVFVNDVFPKDYEALFVGRPLEYLKRGTDAVRIGSYATLASVELVWMPRFRASHLPDPGRFHLYDPLPSVTTQRTVEPGQGEGALRIYGDIGGYDAALYLYRGFQRTPSPRPDDPVAPTRITWFYPPLSVYGASVSGRAGAGVVSVEAAFYDSRDDRAGSDVTVPNSQSRLLLGYQIQPFDDTSIGLQYYAEYLHDHGAYRTALPPGFPADRRWTDTYTARLTQFILHQTLRLSAYVAYSRAIEDRYLNPELRYSFTDNVWGAVGVNMLGGRPWRPYGQLAHDDNAYVQLRYEF